MPAACCTGRHERTRRVLPHDLTSHAVEHVAVDAVGTCGVEYRLGFDLPLGEQAQSTATTTWGRIDLEVPAQGERVSESPKPSVPSGHEGLGHERPT